MEIPRSYIYINPDGSKIKLFFGSIVGQGTWIDPSVIVEGAVIINPDSDSNIGPSVIEGGVTLARGVHIGKGVLVSAGCQLGAGTQIENKAMLGENVVTGPGVGIAEEAIIEKDVSIGQGSVIIRKQIVNPGEVIPEHTFPH